MKNLQFTASTWNSLFLYRRAIKKQFKGRRCFTCAAGIHHIDVVSLAVYGCVCARCVLAHSPERWAVSLPQWSQARIAIIAALGCVSQRQFSCRRVAANKVACTLSYLPLGSRAPNGISVWGNRSSRQDAVDFYRIGQFVIFFSFRSVILFISVFILVSLSSADV